MKPSGKPPVPKYQYKLITVSSSREAGLMETALRDRLSDSGMSFFAICRPNGACDVMVDSWTSPLADAELASARAMAVKIQSTPRPAAK